METKVCTKEEIKAYNAFANLSLDERRRRVYETMAITMPDSPIAKDFRQGKIKFSNRKKERKKK